MSETIQVKQYLMPEEARAKVLKLRDDTDLQLGGQVLVGMLSVFAAKEFFSPSIPNEILFETSEEPPNAAQIVAAREQYAVECGAISVLLVGTMTAVGMLRRRTKLKITRVEAADLSKIL